MQVIVSKSESSLYLRVVESREAGRGYALTMEAALAKMLDAGDIRHCTVTCTGVPLQILQDYAREKIVRGEQFGFTFRLHDYDEHVLADFCRVLLMCPTFVQLGFVGNGSSQPLLDVLSQTMVCYLQKFTVIRDHEFGDDACHAVARLLHASDALHDVNLADCNISEAGAATLQTAVFLQTMRTRGAVRATVYMMSNPAMPEFVKLDNEGRFVYDDGVTHTQFFAPGTRGYLRRAISLSLTGAVVVEECEAEKRARDNAEKARVDAGAEKARAAAARRARAAENRLHRVANNTKK